MKKTRKGPNPMVFAGMGFELLALGAASVYIGPIVDEHFGLKDMGTGILMFTLLGGWLVHFIFLAKTYMEAEEAADPVPENPHNERDL